MRESVAAILALGAASLSGCESAPLSPLSLSTFKRTKWSYKRHCRHPLRLSLQRLGKDALSTGAHRAI